MESTVRIDSYLSQAIKLLHSSAPDSGEKLRRIVDQQISNNYGESKMLKNRLTKNQWEFIHQSEREATGNDLKKTDNTDKMIKEINKSLEIIEITDSSNGEDSTADLFPDFGCIYCSKTDSKAFNQLYACTKCKIFYHQMCHPPKIPAGTDPKSWICFDCEDEIKKKESRSRSSSSSNIKKEKKNDDDKGKKRKSDHHNSHSSKPKKMKESSSLKSYPSDHLFTL